MKKLLLYFGLFILIVFCLPIIFTNEFKTEEVSSEDIANNLNENNIDFDYGNFNDINKGER